MKQQPESAEDPAVDDKTKKKDDKSVTSKSRAKSKSRRRG